MFSDEMNSQISTLEKSLAEAREEVKLTLKEKENLANRLDVLMAANEQHVELKEKQDMQLQVLELRLKEMAQKLDKQKEPENLPVGDEGELMETIKQLQEKTTALDLENQELQAALYEQKTNRLALETKLAKCAEKPEQVENLEALKKLSDDKLELEKILEKQKEEYSVLRKQYEQSLMDANDRSICSRSSKTFRSSASISRFSRRSLRSSARRSRFSKCFLRSWSVSRFFVFCSSFSRSSVSRIIFRSSVSLSARSRSILLSSDSFSAFSSRSLI